MFPKVNMNKTNKKYQQQKANQHALGKNKLHKNSSGDIEDTLQLKSQSWKQP